MVLTLQISFVLIILLSALCEYLAIRLYCERKKNYICDSTDGGNYE